VSICEKKYRRLTSSQQIFIHDYKYLCAAKGIFTDINIISCLGRGYCCPLCLGPNNPDLLTIPDFNCRTLTGRPSCFLQCRPANNTKLICQSGERREKSPADNDNLHGITLSNKYQRIWKRKVNAVQFRAPSSPSAKGSCSSS